MAVEETKKLADDTLGAGKKGLGLVVSEILHPSKWVRNIGICGAVYLSGGIAAGMAQGATFGSAASSTLGGGLVSTWDSAGSLVDVTKETVASTDWGSSFANAASGADQAAEAAVGGLEVGGDAAVELAEQATTMGPVNNLVPGMGT